MVKIFTSDLHHSHKNITTYTDRKLVTTAEDHNDWLVTIWNENTDKQSEIFHLGDLSFASKYDDLAKFVAQLNGNINLIKGNHDKSEFLNRLKADGLINNWWDYKEIKIGDTTTCLFHFMILAWHKQGYGSYHLCGHSHGSLNGKTKGKCLDVGLDSSYNLYGEHRFFTEQDIVEYMNKQVVHVHDHHKER